MELMQRDNKTRHGREEKETDKEGQEEEDEEKEESGAGTTNSLRCSVEDRVGNRTLHKIILRYPILQLQSLRNNKPIYSHIYVSGFLN